MNPLTNVKNTQKLNIRELELGLTGSTASWHDDFRDSAWIFVGGLPYDLTEGDIICVFSQYGEIVNINLVRDRQSGKSKGFCFICYEDQRSTVLTVDNLNSIKLLNRTLRVNHVANYKMPKEFGDEDELTKAIRDGGCAPEVAPPSEDEETLPEVKKPKKEKKKKKEKKSKKKKKQDSESDDEEIVKSSPDKGRKSQGQVMVKQEQSDRRYDKYVNQDDQMHDMDKHNSPREDYEQVRHSKSSRVAESVSAERRTRDERKQYKEIMLSDKETREEYRDREHVQTNRHNTDWERKETPRERSYADRSEDSVERRGSDWDRNEKRDSSRSRRDERASEDVHRSRGSSRDQKDRLRASEDVHRSRGSSRDEKDRLRASEDVHRSRGSSDRRDDVVYTNKRDYDVVYTNKRDYKDRGDRGVQVSSRDRSGIRDRSRSRDRQDRSRDRRRSRERSSDRGRDRMRIVVEIQK